MILELTHLSKTFGAQKILDDLNYQIETPEILALVAPNGTGKTTLLNIIANLEPWDTGQIEILDKTNKQYQIFKEMTYMQDSTVLFPQQTGLDHIRLIQSSYQLSTQQVNRIIDRVGIRNFLKKQVKHYSMGMKQLLLFTLAILPQPKLILLDEPLNGLDPRAINLVREILLDYHQQGTTIIFSSHNLDEIDRLTDNVVFLAHGKLVKPKEDTLTAKAYTVVLNDSAVLKTLVPVAALTILTEHKAILNVTPARFEDLIKKLAGTPNEILDTSVKKLNTEQIYFQLFKNNRIH
ncbi:ABC transporter ATP-binding protein [Agrilactobacillus yilanensis]|nr:ABC transporter ATP-binding protein [Agrilactobacillus yilanensis]